MSHRDPKTYIPLEECIDGHVYRIGARNASYGIYNKEENSFTIARHKFDDVFLFEEYHWDYDGPYGTATPYRDMGPVPDHITHDGAKLTYLDSLHVTWPCDKCGGEAIFWITRNEAECDDCHREKIAEWRRKKEEEENKDE